MEWLFPQIFQRVPAKVIVGHDIFPGFVRTFPPVIPYIHVIQWPGNNVMINQPERRMAVHKNIVVDMCAQSFGSISVF